MSTSPIADIIWMEKTASTSTFLSDRQGKLKDRTVVVADYQSNGRGQNNHVWLSEQGSNLTFSVLLKYDSRHEFKVSEQQYLTMASSLGIVDFLKQHNVEAKIKMPNDIYIDTKKICGILIENAISGNLMSRSIVGIGININQTVFPDDIPNPISMKIITGMEHDIKKCLNELLRHLFDRFDAIWTEPETLKTDYDNNLVNIISFSK